MKPKQRADALSEKLTKEQTEQVLHRLADHTYSEVAAMIAAPAPEGMAIPTSTSAVSRFARLNSEEIGNLQFDVLDDLLAGVNGKYRRDYELYESIDEGNFHLIQEKVFRILAESNPGPRELRVLANVARIAGEHLKQRRQDLREEVRAEANAATVAGFIKSQLAKAA